MSTDELARLVTRARTGGWMPLRELGSLLDRLIDEGDRGLATLVAFLRQASAGEWIAVDGGMRARPSSDAAARRNLPERATPPGRRSAVGELAIAAMDRNGHVREGAVRELATLGDDLAGPLLALRSVDWVTPVATAAHEILAGRIKVDPRAAFTAAPLLVALEARSRATDLLQSVIDAAVADRQLGHELLASRELRVRRRLVREPELLAGLSDDDLVGIVRADPDPFVASRAGIALVDRVGTGSPELLKRLLAGPARLRAAALEAIDAPEVVRPFLVDRSRLVRGAAQQAYRRSGNEPTSVYRDYVAAALHRPIAITELAVIGSQADRLLVLGALAAEDPATRRSAATAVRWIPGIDLPARLSPVLFDESPSVTNAAKRTLRQQAQDIDAGVIGRLRRSPTDHHRRAAYDLMRRRSTVDRLTADLLALADGTTRGREVAIGDLRSWIRRGAANSPQADRETRAELATLLHEVETQLPSGLAELVRFHAGLRRSDLLPGRDPA